MFFFFFFQAEDGIRDAQESRGLGDVYKRQYQRRVREIPRCAMLLRMVRPIVCVLACLAAADAAPHDPLDLGEALQEDECAGQTPYQSGDDCVAACPAGETPNGQTEYSADNIECQACPSGLFADHTSHICVENCPVFLPYTGGGDCLDKCPAGQTPGGQTAVDEANTACAACESGKLADHGAHVCVDTCPDGRKYNDGRDCMDKCPAGQTPGGQEKKDDDNVDKCAFCSDGKLADHVNHMCVDACPVGRPYNNGKDCLSQCPRGQTPGGQEEVVEANKDCKNCDDGKLADHKTHVCVDDCPEARPYNDGKDCLSTCPRGQAPAGQTEMDPENQVCEFCPFGTFADHEEQLCVAECGSGQTPDRDGKDCDKCGDGMYADHEAHQCVAECPRGKVPGAAGEGEFGQEEMSEENKDCQPCEADKMADHRTHVCTSPCPPERPYNDGKDCLAKCGAGQTPMGQTKEDKSESNKTCLDCEDGKYADHNEHVCVDTCPAGQTPGGQTSDNETPDNKDCEACPGGKFADHELHVCVDTCPDGRKYNDGRDCMDKCPAGQTPGGQEKMDNDNIECAFCEAGKFADHESHTCANDCPAGYTANVDTDNCDEDAALVY
eukprot:TRINITY_DN762_c0_g2_i1.p1 TRINITY_DN762_c0_g2~~TRINITY_DN762_c0_g2_i1.p1  ORF type:complete len:609 (-),score=133.28 TRINITY_DN762_c0_g2_i1:297-2123(-)